MKVFFDARFTAVGRHDGVSRYGTELLRAYGRINPDATMMIHDREQLKMLPDLPYVILNDPTKPAELSVAKKLNELGADVVFSPMQIFGGGKHKFKLILTLHDMIYYHFRKPPHRLKPHEKLAWRTFHTTYIPQRLTLNRADAIVTVSQSSRDEILAAKLTKKPVSVIYNAPIDISVDAKPTEKILVYMGSFMEYKNVETLIRAMGDLPEYKLVLCSRIDEKRRTQLMNFAKNPSQIVWKDGVTDNEYLNLLSRATALVNASKYEGFNLSLIEAMNAGAPVICSNLPVYHEVANDAALFFAPDNEKTFAKNVRKLENQGLRSEMIEKGFANAKRFSWDASARELDALIKSL